MRARSFLLIGFFLALSPKIFADEGMWLPYLIRANHAQLLQEKGFNISPEYLYDENNPSVKDAVVLLSNNAGSASIISNQGLILANYNSLYPYILNNSSIENDILKEGFWAKSKKDELECEGLSVFILQKMKDVTNEMTASIPDSCSEAIRQEWLNNNLEMLKQKNSEGGKYIVEITAIFASKNFVMSVYKEFRDVRLVGTPPQNISNFGGSTDNSMWPRHSADFCLLRIYTDSTGNSATYDTTNIPLKPKFHLTLSEAPLKEGDPTMVWGYPSSTARYVTSYQIDYIANVLNPPFIEACNMILPNMKVAMNDEKSLLGYGDIYTNFANIWKQMQGENSAIIKREVIEAKKQYEIVLQQWMEEYQQDSTLQPLFASMKASREKADLDAHKAFWYANISMLTSKTLILPLEMHEIKPDKWGRNKKENAKRENEFIEKYLDITEYINKDLEKKMVMASIQLWQKLPKVYQPQIHSFIEISYKNDFTQFADAVCNSSIFSSEKSIKKFLKKPSIHKYETDPLVRYYYALIKMIKISEAKVREVEEAMTQEVESYMNIIFNALGEQNYALYPNANGTLRYNMGKVSTYDPRDGVTYHAHTSLDGIVKKYDNNSTDFTLPEEYVKLLRNNNNNEIPVCFITNNDIANGSPGSPVLNANGQLVGLAFDVNWEALANKVKFDYEVQRSINLSIPYFLFILREYAHAENILEELKACNEEPQTNTN